MISCHDRAEIILTTGFNELVHNNKKKTDTQFSVQHELLEYVTFISHVSVIDAWFE